MSRVPRLSDVHLFTRHEGRTSSSYRVCSGPLARLRALRVYAHLIPGDARPVLDPDTETARGGNRVVTEPTGTERTQAEWLAPETAI